HLDILRLMTGRIFALMLAIVLTAHLAEAQTTTAAVLGTVTDTQKAVLPGVTVTARNVETGSEAREVTDGHGRFRLAGLRPGIYNIRAEIGGFSTREKKGIQLFLGQEATIDFEVAVAGVQETVTVTTAAPVVEVTKSEVSNVIDKKQIDALPL